MFYFCSAKVSPKKIISKIATINFDLLFDRPQISRFGKPGNREVTFPGKGGSSAI